MQLWEMLPTESIQILRSSLSIHVTVRRAALVFSAEDCCTSDRDSPAHIDLTTPLDAEYDDGPDLLQSVFDLPHSPGPCTPC